MADRYNEGKALDAVLRFIEEREHAPRENDGRSPDNLNDWDEQRRVDYVCTVGQTLYAFEHTGIEPFPNQIRLAERHLVTREVYKQRHSAALGEWRALAA